MCPAPQRAQALGGCGRSLVTSASWGSPSPAPPDTVSLPVFQVHAYIISSLKKEMPNVFGKESKKKELVNNLGEIYQKIEREHQISPGDFPSLRKMQVWLPCLASHTAPPPSSVAASRCGP